MVMVTIPSDTNMGSAAAVNIIDDSTLEGTEMFTVNVLSTSSTIYSITPGVQGSLTVFIPDDESK